MRSLLVSILWLAAALTVPAAETPDKFAGRWAGITDFGHSKNPGLNNVRALLTFEVNADGSITNGAIRDLAGYGLAFFGGQLDAHGRLTADVIGAPGSYIARMKINLGHTTGTGTYRTRIHDLWDFRSTIRFWREQKPTRGNGESVNSSVSDALSQTTISGYISTSQHFRPPDPPAAPNP